MKIISHFWSYLDQFFLEWKMLQTNAVEKIKTSILCLVTFFPEKLPFNEIVWKNTVEQDRPHMTIWRMRFAWWITKATDTYSEYVILILHGNSGYANAPHCYVYTYIACLVMYVLTEKRRRAPKTDCWRLCKHCSLTDFYSDFWRGRPTSTFWNPFYINTVTNFLISIFIVPFHE